MKVSVGQEGWRETNAVKLGSLEVAEAWRGDARVHPTSGPVSVSKLCFRYPQAGTLNARMLTWYNENGEKTPEFAKAYWCTATFYLPQLVDDALSWKQATSYSIESGLVKVPVANMAFDLEAMEAAITAGHLPFLGIDYTYQSKVVANGERSYVNAPLLWQKTPTAFTTCDIKCSARGKVARVSSMLRPGALSGLCVQDANGFVVAQCAAVRKNTTEWGDALRVFSADHESDYLRYCEKIDTDVSNQASWLIGFNILGSPYGGASLTMTGYTASLDGDDPVMPYGYTYLEYSHAE